jgi:hypothetical protein
VSGPPPDRPPRSAAAKGLLVAAFAALAVAAGVLAHAALFGRFSAYDDEGYMLLALRAWRAGGGLYDRIETVYGPTTFQLAAAVFSVLRLPLDNAGARVFVLGIWIVATFLCALCVFRVHRSLLAATIAAALVFPILLVLANEPLHAGGVVVLILSVIALVSLRLGEGGSRTWFLLGALTAALALTKLNVGVFAALALGGAWLRSSPRNAWMSTARAFFSAVLVAFPFLLVHAQLAKPWVAGFAVVTTASLAPFALLVHAPSGGRPSTAADLRGAALGALAFAAVSLGICFATGTTVAGAWRCLVTDTLRFPDLTADLTTPLPPTAEVVLSLLLVPVTFVLARGRRPGAAKALALLRLAASLGLLYASTSVERHLLALPCLWPFALPRSDRRAAFLASLVALQALHVFPVPASQRGFFGFLLPVVAIVGFVDAWKELRPEPRAWEKVLAAVAACALVALEPLARELVLRFEDYRRDEVELGLPGTRGIRLPERQVANYVWLAENLRRNGDTFLGVPGRHSFYLWAEEDPPVPFYSAWWPVALDEARQRALGEALFAHPAPCVVRAPGPVTGWKESGVLRASILARWIDERFETVGRVSMPGLELLLPKGKTPDLVLTAFLEPARLRLALPERRGASLARVAVVHAASGAVLCDSGATDPAKRVSLVDETGKELDVPIPLDRRRDVVARYPAGIDDVRLLQSIVRCYDARGEFEARLPVLR